MYYHLIERYNPNEPTAPKKWYPQLTLAKKLDLRCFAQEIVGRSSLTLGDVENCLQNFVDMIPTFLLLGHSISLGDLGTLRASILSHGGAATIGDWDASLIKGVKIIFTPGTLLKNRLRDEATFELKIDKDALEARRISRAEAVLRNAQRGEQTAQSHFLSLDKEEALRQLRELQQQIEAGEAKDATPEAPSPEASSSEATSSETPASETSKSSDDASKTSSTDGDTSPKK